MQGRILKATGGFYYVLSDAVLYECRARGLFRKNGVSPLVGDWVEIEAGFQVFCTGLDQDSDLAMLRRSMEGKISAFCGNSGVGKSSLLNRIDSRLDLSTAQISQKLGRGRHTTRHVQLYPV